MNSVTETGIETGKRRGRPPKPDALDAKARMRGLRARARGATEDDLERLPDSGLIEAVRMALRDKDKAKLAMLARILTQRAGFDEPGIPVTDTDEVVVLRERIASMSQDIQTMRRLVEEQTVEATHQAAEASLLRGQLEKLNRTVISVTDTGSADPIEPAITVAETDNAASDVREDAVSVTVERPSGHGYSPAAKAQAIRMKRSGETNLAILAEIKRQCGKTPDKTNLARLIREWAKDPAVVALVTDTSTMPTR